MDIFYWQLLLSFLVGGLAVGILSIWVERTSTQTAAIILSLPTTLAVTLFFMGWVLSPQAVSDSIIAVPLPLAASVFFMFAYVLAAKKLPKKSWSPFLSALLGILFWFLMAFFVILYGPLSLFASLLGYGVIVAIIQWLFLREKSVSPKPSRRPKGWGEKIFRSIFGGVVIGTAVLLSKLLGPLWGAIFSVFPAFYLSNMVILHHYNGASILPRVVKFVPLTSTSNIVYPLCVGLFYPLVGIGWGTLFAYGVAILYLVVLRKGLFLFGKGETL